MRDDMSTILARARTLGAEHAEQDIELGIFPLAPDLSGEYADNLTPSTLARECGYTGDEGAEDAYDVFSEIAEAYEEGYEDTLSEMNASSPVQPEVTVDGREISPRDYPEGGHDETTVGVTLNENGAYPSQAPLGWCNSARIVVSPEDDEVSVTISTGDPRGAFVMSVSRASDGRLLLYVPHEGMSTPHEDIREIHPGTFEVR